MKRQDRVAWAFNAPVLAGTLVMLVVPMIGTLLLSLTDFDIYALGNIARLRWVGLDNYAYLLGDALFWQTVRNTLAITVLGVPAALATSLGAAVLIDSATVRWKPVWRVLLFAPYASTLVATALVWRFVLDAQTGLLNAALSLAGLPKLDWLGDPRLSIPAVVLFVVWKVFGYNMLVFIAALSQVPHDLHDAARLDGAGAWMRFRHVVLPAIGPALLLAAVLSIAGFLQIFAEPYVMTQGGPAQSTTTILYLMFQQGFEWWNLGRASAIAVLLFAAVLAVTQVQLWAGRRSAWA